MEVRIQKYLSDCGVLSRRKAEEEIKAGHVLVNGQSAMIGQKINPHNDAVQYRGQLVEK
ncbi:MAG TPA: pseudouridine synthase, partial [Clostridiales bacterium]|nr:pseudouridine synthase [Clostridiales bacterium]